MIVRAFSRIDESACNPKPKNPFNVLHDDLANHTHNFRPCALSLSAHTVRLRSAFLHSYRNATSGSTCTALRAGK
jgi:hypothetical protein